jgi:hypothetical protein
VESFSGEKYRLLESIFSWEEDVAFLASETGYSPKIGLRHRKAKRKLAYEWLRQLRAEFDEVYRQGLVLLMESPIERPDLQRSLRRSRITFYKRMTLLRLRLLWCSPAADDVRCLRTALEDLIAYGWIIQEETIPTPCTTGP